MKAQLLNILKLILYWLLLFNITRLLFIIYFIEKFQSYTFLDSLSVFYHAFKLDIATVGYVVPLPIILSFIYLFISGKWFKWFNKIYNLIILLILSIITVGDLGIYHAWGTKLNQRAISFLAYPDEAFASMGSAPIYLYVLLCLVVIVLGYFLFQLIFRKDNFLISSSLLYKQYPKPKSLIIPSTFLLIAFINIMMIRGGLQVVPINESSAYFSEHSELNHASVNTSWFLIHSLFENRDNPATNPYIFYPEKESESIVDKLLKASRDSTFNILSSNNPNIVLIVLEGFTADVVEELGGMKGVSPNISSLIKNGLLFTNIYSPGFRTDQGLTSILSSFPSQPLTSIIKQADKIENLPTLTKKLMSNGYSSSYYYGGELGFGNMKAFILHNGFQSFTSIDDYPEETMSNKWGAHDEYVLLKQAQELDNKKQPFFSFLLTLSSHEPYQVPIPTKFDNGTEEYQFANSCYYTDYSIGKYFEAIRKKQWFKNTLFIICADHGSSRPYNREYNEPKRFHIPLLFYGDVIKPEYRGKTINTIGSQLDINTTILSQLKISDSDFYWSNNLLNPFRHQFAFYTFDEGEGWVYKNGSLTYDVRSKKYTYWYDSKTDTTKEREANSYLQVMFDKYMNY